MPIKVSDLLKDIEGVNLLDYATELRKALPPKVLARFIMKLLRNKSISATVKARLISDAMSLIHRAEDTKAQTVTDPYTSMEDLERLLKEAVDQRATVQEKT